MDPGQLRYLILVVDYFTKYIKFKALANITTTNIVNFFKRNMLARFVVPQAFVIDNGTNFIDKRLINLIIPQF